MNGSILTKESSCNSNHIGLNDGHCSLLFQGTDGSNGGARDARPIWVQFLFTVMQFSREFGQKIGWCAHLGSWCPPTPLEILDPPLHRCKIEKSITLSLDLFFDLCKLIQHYNLFVKKTLDYQTYGFLILLVRWDCKDTLMTVQITIAASEIFRLQVIWDHLMLGKPSLWNLKSKLSDKFSFLGPEITKWLTWLYDLR